MYACAACDRATFFSDRSIVGPICQSLISKSQSFIDFPFFCFFQGLAADRDGIVKLKNVLKDMNKAGNSK